MFTSYDDIWTYFRENCMTSDINLPQYGESIYKSINNAVKHFNNRMRTTYLCDDDGETLNELLSDDHLLILVHYLRLIFLINQKTYFETTWQPFQKDIGMKNFQPQLKAIENSIEVQKDVISSLIINTAEDFL